MVRFLSFLALTFILATTLSSCEKCYDCTKKCGVCTAASLPTLSGCTGDENLNGASVDTWKIYLETQGYTCTYNNVEENVCGKEARDNKKATFYECVSE